MGILIRKAPTQKYSDCFGIFIFIIILLFLRWIFMFLKIVMASKNKQYYLDKH